MDRAERAGLGAALVGHAALAAIILYGLFSPKPLPRLETPPVEVQLVTELAPVARAPKHEQSPPAPKPSPAPGFSAPPPEPEPAPQPKPLPVPPKVEPKVVPKLVPTPVSKPTPKPLLPKPTPPKPAPAKPQPAPRPMAKPVPPKPALLSPVKPAQRGTSQPAPTKPVNTKAAPRGSGLSRSIVEQPTASPAAKPVTPAPVLGPTAADILSIKKALGSEIGRQLKPRWKAPTGADIDQLVTILSWTLNKDGSLAGDPVFVSQSGVTDSNRAQAELHRENAIKAVRAAAPFKLPPEHYTYWKSVISFRFDKRLSQ